MFELPDLNDVRKCVVSGETITNGVRPLQLTRGGQSVDFDIPQELRSEPA